LASGLTGKGRQTTNDVYVLNDDLKQTGAILDLGLTERIYSARFVGDRGYLVTFRQTDPFYVLDLSDPEHPVRTGELKIPGFSSYLHPLTSELVLGVGSEDGKVKLSLFDVSNPANPQELDKYFLDEYWSEVSSNHHAFLQDPKHLAFFMPAGSKGYIMSYRDRRLSLAKVASEAQPVRALYIDDALYLVGNNKIQVLEEQNWNEIGKLEF
jgi:inhibitor of cysteine peptidase